jgi:hypothetical protein
MVMSSFMRLAAGIVFYHVSGLGKDGIRKVLENVSAGVSDKPDENGKMNC